MIMFIRKFLFPSLVLIGMIFFAACEYEPTGQNFVEVDQDVPALVTDLTMNSESDTIWCNSSKAAKFNFKISAQNKRFNKVCMFVDGKLHHTGYSLVFGFGISSSKKNVAYDTVNLSFDAHFSAGTGSLADNLKSESTVINMKCTVIFYNKEYFDIQPVRIEDVGGKLKISWDDLPFKTFKKALLVKSVKENIYNSTYTHVVANLDTMTENYTFDHNYIGERANYFIRIVESNDNIYRYPDNLWNGNFPILRYEAIDDTTFKLIWNKCQYPDNFDEYNIEIGHSGYTFSNIVDTSMVMRMSCGSRTTFVLSIKPKHSNEKMYGLYYTGNDRSKVEMMNGMPSFRFEEIRAAGKGHVIYHNVKYYEPIYHIYDIVNDKDIGSITSEYWNSNMTVSPNGKYAVLMELENVKFFRDLDTTNVQEISISKLTNGITDKNSSFYCRSISDEGILYLGCGGKLCLYDLANNRYLKKYSLSTTAIISPDGNYLITLNFGDFYKIESGKLSKIGEIEDYSDFRFDPENSSRVFVRSSSRNQISILDLNSFDIVEQINLNVDNIQVDFYSDSFVKISKKNLKLYDMQSWELLKDLPCISDVGKGFYHHNIYYFDNGVKIDLGN